MRKRTLAAVGFMSLMSGPANAASDFWCTSHVLAAGQDSSGGVWMRLDEANNQIYLFVCDIRQEPSYCQGMLSILLSAKAAERSINMRVMGTATASSCGTIPVDWTRDLRPVWLEGN